MDLIKEIVFKKISAKGLAVFRIFFALNFLFEIIWIFRYRQLYFDTLPYLDVHFPDVTLLLLIWMGVVVCICIGLYTRIATIVNYIFTLVFISSMTNYEYHMIYTYICVNFLLMFLPIQKALSFDMLRKKIRYLNKGLFYEVEKVSKVTYLAPVFIALGLVYFDAAVVYKMKSPMWLHGLGIWLPSSLPQITMTDSQWLLNQEIFVKFLSHLTMLFEFMFIFLFWNKKFRVIMLIIGVGLHFGILLIYPIPYFAIGYITIYLLLVPVSIWDKIGKMINTKQKKNILYFDEKLLASCKIMILMKFFDVFKNINFITKSEAISLDIYDKEKPVSNLFSIDAYHSKIVDTVILKDMIRLAPLCYVLLKIQTLLDIKENFLIERKEMVISNIVHKNPRVQNYGLLFLLGLAVFLQIHLNHSFFKTSIPLTNSIKYVGYHYIGITGHGVFKDVHFRGYNRVYSIRYKGQLLPILDEKGLLDRYMAGGTYAYWIWRVNGPYVSKNALSVKKGIIEYSSFWSYKNKIDLSKKQEFEIVQKKVKVSFEWEENLLHKNMESPWEKIGILIWNNKTPQLIWD